MITANKNVAQKYVQLALAIERHLPGYVDAYSGPSQWRDESEKSDPRPVAELALETEELMAMIDTDHEMDLQRRDYLSRHIRAMQTTLGIIQGKQFALADEVESLYDIRPEWIDENIFEESHRVLDSLLPPGDSLAERMINRRKENALSAQHLLECLDELSVQFRQRTRARFPLPTTECIEVQLVTGQPWYAYNWYLGNYSSRIDINTDFPFGVIELALLVAHECYPGHHTELSIKDASLVHDKGWVEHSVAPINAPSCVVSEGIATNALSILLPDDELTEWCTEELFPRYGFSRLEAQSEVAIVKAWDQLLDVRCNAAFMLHDHGAIEDEVINYIIHYALVTEKEASKDVRFLKSPLYRSYIFNYRYGREMLDALFKAKDDRDQWFSRLLTEPVTPTQIRTWTNS